MRDALTRTLAEMGRRDIDVLLLGREDNARFVSGATRLWLAGTRPFAPGCVVVRETRAVHLLNITDEGVPEDLPPDHLFPITWNPMNLVGTVAALDGVTSARRVGVDGLSPMFEQLLAMTLPDAELIDGDRLLRDVRRVKTTEEIEHVRGAIDVAQRALHAAVNALRPGVRERDLLGVFEESMASSGVTTPAYEGAFCVVDSDGVPRHFPTDRAIDAGDLVVLDAGVLRDGWEGSLARTWPCGMAAPASRERLRRWHVAWSPLVARVRAGATVSELRAVDGAHVHGIGLGYEPLFDDDVLAPGMVVSLGLARDGVVGKETLLVSQDRSDLLTAFPYASVG